MIQARRTIGLLTTIAVVCAGAVVLQTRAAVATDQPPAARDSSGAKAPPTVSPTKSAPATGPSASPPAAKAAAEPPTLGAKAAAKPPAPGAPQVPEESATIRDDPTIAPDPKQSADNNVSFPSDI